MKRIAAAGAMLVFGAFAANASDFGAAGPDPIPSGPIPMMGYLEIYGQAAWNDYWTSSYSPWVGLGGAGRLNWWSGPETSMQLDFAAQQSAESASNYYWTGSAYGALHYAKRNQDYLLGVFGGVAAVSDYEGYYGWDQAIFLGVEGQRYFGPATWYAQAGWIQQFAGYSEAFSYFFGQIEGRYFFGPNTKLAANVGVVTGSIWSGSTQTTFSYGVELEHMFASSPMSIFARWQGFTGSGYYDINGSRVMAGFKAHWGAGSLEQQDRSGATLKVMEDLTAVGDVRGFD